jgi:hypothetical protein
VSDGGNGGGRYARVSVALLASTFSKALLAKVHKTYKSSINIL